MEAARSRSASRAKRRRSWVAAGSAASPTDFPSPHARSLSPSNRRTIVALREATEALLRDTDAPPPPSRASTSRAFTSRAAAADTTDGVIVELFMRDRTQGMRPVARSLPVALRDLTARFMLSLAEYSHTELNESNFFVLWRVMRQDACTVQLGHGNQGSVFRVCKDAGACRECVAVKLGIVMNADGTVHVGEGTERPDGLSDDEWSVAKAAQALTPSHAGLRMKGLSIDEVNNTRAVTERVLATQRSPHVMQYLHHFMAPSGLLLFLEYVPPLYTAPVTVASWNDLVRRDRGGPRLPRMPDADWRCLVFQALYTLGALQATFPGFRHNDTKADNWGVRPWDGADHCYTVHRQGGGSGGTMSNSSGGSGTRQWVLPKQDAQLKLLDFGIAHSSGREVYCSDVAHARDVAKVGPQFLAFGVVPDPCPLHDAHLLFTSLFLHLQAADPPPPWLRAFQTFVTDCIPAKYFTRPRLTQYHRLNVDAERELNRDPAAARSVADMLAHPYFDMFLCTDPRPHEYQYSV